MYSSVHGAAAAAIVVAGYDAAGPLGAALALIPAIASHDLLDRFGEAGYGPLPVTLRWEAIPFAVFAAAAWVSGIWWVFAVGWVAGNLFDLIDKRAYAAIIWPGRVSMGYAFACHRRTPEMPLTLGKTKASAVIATAMVVIMALGWRMVAVG